MKSNVLIKKIISVILILIILLTTKVYATNDSFGTTLKINSTETKREDSVTITIGLKDINIESGEKGIGAYTARIKFDSDVFEYDSTNGTNKWEAPFYQNGLIVGNTKDGEVAKTIQDIGTITLKVKKDAKLGETTIELADFSGSTVENDVLASNISIKLTVIDDNNNNNNGNNNNNNNNNGDNNNNNNGDNNNNNNGDNNNNNNNNNNGNNNNNNNDNGNNNNNNQDRIPNIDNTTNNVIASGELPKTGEGSIVLIICIGLSIVCSVVCYIKMKN